MTYVAGLTTGSSNVTMTTVGSGFSDAPPPRVDPNNYSETVTSLEENFTTTSISTFNSNWTADKTTGTKVITTTSDDTSTYGGSAQATSDSEDVTSTLASTEPIDSSGDPPPAHPGGAFDEYESKKLHTETNETVATISNTNTVSEVTDKTLADPDAKTTTESNLTTKIGDGFRGIDFSITADESNISASQGRTTTSNTTYNYNSSDNYTFKITTDHNDPNAQTSDVSKLVSGSQTGTLTVTGSTTITVHDWYDDSKDGTKTYALDPVNDSYPSAEIPVGTLDASSFTVTNDNDPFFNQAFFRNGVMQVYFTSAMTEMQDNLIQQGGSGGNSGGFESPTWSQEPVGGYWSGVGSVFKGYWNAITGTVTGLYTIARHPIQTAYGLGTAILHPILTSQAIIEDIKTKSRTLEGQGELVGDILIGFATGGAMKVVKESAKAGKIGVIISKIKNKIPGRSRISIDDVYDATKKELKILDQPCFPAGTPILTAMGWKPIEEIVAGDVVLSRSEQDVNAPVGPQTVEEAHQRQGEILTLTIGGQKIQTTTEHPFWVKERGWVEACELRSGDQLSTSSGNWTEIEAVSHDGEITTVYNMTVKNWHTYFIGDPTWNFDVWVHNNHSMVSIGLEGEQLAGISKNTKHIDSLSGKKAYRIPDELTEGTLTEVKNVKYQHFSSQLQDSLHYSMMEDLDMVLVVRPDTKISKQLQDAIDSNFIQLEFLK